MIYMGLTSVLWFDKDFKIESGNSVNRTTYKDTEIEVRISVKTNKITFARESKFEDLFELTTEDKIAILESLGISKELVELEEQDKHIEGQPETSKLSTEQPKSKSLAEQMIERYGENAQLDIVVEELSELIKEVIKYKRTKTHGEPYDINHMAEELADAYVVTDIVQAVLNSHGITEDKIQEIVDYKRQRTKHRYLDK